MHIFVQITKLLVFGLESEYCLNFGVTSLSGSWKHVSAVKQMFAKACRMEKHIIANQNSPFIQGSPTANPMMGTKVWVAVKIADEIAS